LCRITAYIAVFFEVIIKEMSIFDHFQQISLTQDQENALTRIQDFLDSQTDIFLLKGYAGSGKTTLIKGIVEYLHSIEKSFALMAPTGRAAKIIREKTGQEALTIHKTIYSFDEMKESEEGDSFFYYYKIRNNTDAPGKIFVVDEASMISDAKNEGEFFRFGTGHLLTDLISYTRVSEENVHSKIIFVGDPCQLAPVGDNCSRAFSLSYLHEKFNVSVEETEIKEVVRHVSNSGILRTAKRLRRSITSGFFNDFNIESNDKDSIGIYYDGFLDLWETTTGPKIIIASKNKTCLDLNIQIREKRFGYGTIPIRKSDIVITGGNNYRLGVLNGEFAVVNSAALDPVSRTVSLKGKPPVTLIWRDVELIFPDSEISNKVIRGKMLENFLNGDNSLRPEEWQALYVDFKNRHDKLKPKTAEFKEAITQDEYFNCLLLKYGYAVTCHKAQGGEWDSVFTVWDHDTNKDFNCFTDKQLRQSKDNEFFFRWAYTAITRASGELFSLNAPYFNSYSDMTFIDTSVMNSLSSLSGNRIEVKVIPFDKELLLQMERYGVINQPIQVQDHFIRVRHAVRKQYIEISGWEKKNLEVFYSFKREDKVAVLKTWVNKDLVFNGKYQRIPSMTNSDDFCATAESLLKALPAVFIKRDNADTVLRKIEFDIETEEKFPFTKNLFEDISGLIVKTDIYIDDIDHQQYKERYTFRRNTEVAVIDFEYKKTGFFGRIVPLQSLTNSQALLNEIWTSLQTLKKEKYAG